MRDAQFEEKNPRLEEMTQLLDKLIERLKVSKKNYVDPDEIHKIVVALGERRREITKMVPNTDPEQERLSYSAFGKDEEKILLEAGPIKIQIRDSKDLKLAQSR